MNEVDGCWIHNHQRMEGVQGYLIHDHLDHTSEGFGSHARGVLYPLLHIALSNQLLPILPHYLYEANTARDYSALRSLADFLSLPKEVPPTTVCHEIEINTWSDPVVGSACGDGTLLASLIQDYLNKSKQPDSAPLILIRLVGALRYMHPTKVVYDFLQSRSLIWNENRLDGRLRIAAHVRVPEEFCPETWKDDNHHKHLIYALRSLERHIVAVEKCDVVVYTEEAFSETNEMELQEHFPNARVVRGTSSTLLENIRALATADVLIPSSSHFSAIAGYLSHGLIVLSNPSRWEYFKPHFDLDSGRLVEAKDIGKRDNGSRLLRNSTRSVKIVADSATPSGISFTQERQQPGHGRRSRNYRIG
jgi:hypothetical protein